MKTYNLTIIFALCVILISVACSELADSTCQCTERACFSKDNPVITLAFEITSSQQLNSEDFDSITVVQLKLDNTPLDSIETSFVPIEFGSSTLQLKIGEEYSNFRFPFSESKLLIKNIDLQQNDTISNISYNAIETEEVCNVCSGGPNCQDETYIVITYNSPNLSYNQLDLSSFEIPYTVKE
ncbi:hypothetical protein [Reichenbachiella versicolor]|uniref:hypothetical protein n=1 Tax=Reichenbachiella versicolor TaxID=1821036 RepID=UPI000D6E5CD0|nr:hypothetical protein [Reichenbachiella versicolor]